MAYLITKRQQELLEFIIDYIRENDMPPTISEMVKALGVHSKNAISKLLQELESKKYIERDTSPRGIKILNSLGKSLQKGIVSLPLLGEVPAGGPMLTEEFIDGWIKIPALLTKGKSNTFLLKVTGESMIGAGIFDKDIVVVWPNENYRTGDIVVAEMEGEVTVKRLIKDGSKIYLKAENPSFKDIHPLGEWTIQGKVIGVMRTVN